MPRVPVPRPSPRTAYRVVARNRQVAEDWAVLLRMRLGPCTACWDHLAAQPLTPVGSRYTRLKGSLASCVFEGQTLPHWQYETDNGARVKVGIGAGYVVLMSVSSGHPKENE